MAPTDEGQRPQSKRRWLRFSLKTVFVLVTLYCVWLADGHAAGTAAASSSLAMQELHGRRRVRISSWMLKAIGSRIRSHLSRPGSAMRWAKITFAAWRSSTSTRGRDPTDDDLRVLEDLTDVQQLTLSNRKKITDAGLAHLAGLKHLNVLVLDGTSVTGPGLHYLRACSSWKA